MKTIPRRVSNAYFQLKKSRLITKQAFDEDAIKHFANLLNSALPVTEYEKIIFHHQKELFHDDKKKYLKYINSPELQCLILLTDNKNIIQHFGLSYKLYINWDNTAKKYIVQKYEPQGDNFEDDISDF